MSRAFFRHLMLGLLLAAGLALVASEAVAAPADSVCRGVAPAVGQTLKGPILHVVDGDHLCVAQDVSPETWVEVQVLDAALQKAVVNEHRTRGALMAAAFAQNAVCEITGVAGGVPLADCRIEGEALSSRLSAPDIVKTGQAWR